MAADIQQILTALRNADAAGDTEAATRLAGLAKQFTPAPPVKREVGIGEAAGIGFERGVGRFGSTITDIIPALVGSAVGADEYAKRQLEEAATKEAALPAPVFESYKDVEGIGDAAKFVAETMGEQVPNLGMALGTALTGGAAAPALLGGRAVATKAATEIAKKEAAKLVAKQATAGQLAGAGLGSYALNAPEVFQNIFQETGELAPATALLFGAAAAALDSVLPAALARNISAPVKAEAAKKLLLKSGMKPSVLRSGTVGLAKGVGTEGITEGAQEAISIAAERLIDDNPDLFGSREWDRIMESSVRGAVAGGGFGTIGGGVQGAREKSAARREQAAVEQREREAAEEAVKAEAEAALVAEIDTIQGQSEQGDLFGAPVASTLVPPARPEGESEVTASEARYMAGRPVPATPIAKFTDAEVRTEAKRRASVKKTEESVEFANVWKDVKEARAAEAEAIGNKIKAQVEMFSPKGNLTNAVASQNTEINALEKQERAKNNADLNKLRKEQAAARKALVAATNKAKIAKNKALQTDKQAAFSFEPSAKETAEAVAKQAAEREAAVISEAENIVRTRYADTRNEEGTPLNLAPPSADTVAADVEIEADIIRNRAPAEEARQGNLLTGELPGEQTRAPLVGKDLNKFINNLGLPANQANKTALAGLDLAIPEQRATAIKNLEAKAETANGANATKLAAAIAQLRGTSTTTAPAPAPAPAPAVEAEVVEEVAVDKKIAEIVRQVDAGLINVAEGNRLISAASSAAKMASVRNPPANDIPPEAFAYFPDGKITDAGIKQLAIAQAKNLTKSKAVRDTTDVTKAFNWFMNEDNTSVTDAHLDTYQKALTSYRLKAPIYEGATFDAEISNLAERGQLAPLLNKLIPSQPAEIKRILQKVRAMKLTTKVVVGPTPEGTSGFYDAATDVITLDPTTGMNEHTFLHETAHAALAQAVSNPDLEITKEFFKFFSDIQLQMGGFYGGQNLQEFVAEILGNPEFRALLQATKAPKAPTNQNMLTQIYDSILRFFGFRKGQSAYDKALDFIDKLLDVAPGLEPTLQDKLFLGTPKMGAEATSQILNSAPAFVGKKVDNVRNAMSRVYSGDGGGTFISNVLSAFRLQDMVKMTAKQFPALSRKIKALQEALIRRQGEMDKKTEAITAKYTKLERIAKKYPEQMLKLNEIAQAAKRAGFDLLGIEDIKRFDKNALTPEQQKEYAQLSSQLKNLPKEVQDAYSIIVTSLRERWVEYRTLVLGKAETKAQKNALELLFDKTAPLIGYVPSKRFGDYHLEYTDNTKPKGERVATAFESPKQRQDFEDANAKDIKGDVKRADKLEDIRYRPSDHPSDSLINQIMEAVPAEYRDEIYQAHLSFMPKESILQNTKRYEGTKGESKDILRSWADTITRVSSKVNSLQYSPQVDGALSEINETETTGLGGAFRNEILKRRDFMLNPTYSKMTSRFATGAYSLFLLGNISSGLVNTSAILLLTYPRLVARYGFNDANTVLLSAMKEALPSFVAKEKRAEEGLLKYKWQSDPKYKVLLEALEDRGQLKHTLNREIMEGARKDTVDYNSKAAKMMNLLSVPMSGTEKYSRATTALATFNLAKKKGKSDAEAAAEAVNTVIDVHTTGMAAEGPRLMQHDVGRVTFTFKSFIWNSAIFTGMNFYDSVSKEDTATRAMARKQLLGIYAISAALGGINGLPFFGAGATLANILEALNPFDDDDEPFNAKEEIRAVTNELMYKGPLNYVTNLEFSNRIGLANGMLFREDPYSVEERGYMMTALMQALGPVGSYGFNIATVPGLLAEEEYIRAAEAMSPSATRNLAKASRYFLEGATTRRGVSLETDINGYNLFMQAFGFSPADLASLYENRSMALNFQTKQNKRLTRIKKKYYIGIEAGDSVIISEAVEELNEMRMEFPALADNKTLARSYKSRKAYEQELILGLRIQKAYRDPINERFLDEFID